MKNSIYVRRAKAEDLPVVNKLLYQVEDLHRIGRPDLFKPGEKKYTDSQLLEIFSDDSRPVFVAAQRCVTEGGCSGSLPGQKSVEGVSERVLGYAFCIVQETAGAKCIFDHKTLYIDDLCVDESARGKGVGKILYDCALGFAKSTGCHNVTLHVWDKNPGARAFYQKMGMGVQQTTMEVIL